MKKATPMYTSQIEWKKVQALYGNLLSNSITNETGESVTLLDFMQKYYETSVDPLAMQHVEKSRNLVKYMNDALSRIVPMRCVAGKGMGWKYPELGAEAIKLSLVSTDAIAHVLIPDSQMDRLNDTYTYIEGDSAEARQPKKSKKKKSDPSEGESGKQSVSRIDIVEETVKTIVAKLKAKSIVPKTETLSMCRRKLLEFVLRQTLMEVRIISANKESVKTIKTLEQATAHFEQVIFNIHAQDIETGGQFDAADPEGGREEESQGDGDKSVLAFILSVPAEVVKQV